MTGSFVVSLVSLNPFHLFLVVILIWIIGHIIYRLYFHPLAKVPGPTLAAITWLYQTYYSFIGGSRFYLRIERLHRIYGMVL